MFFCFVSPLNRKPHERLILKVMEESSMVGLVFWKDDSAWSVWTGLEQGVDRVGGYRQDWRRGQE